MADNITTLAKRLEPILRRRLSSGDTFITNVYQTTSGGGSGEIDVSYLVPQSRELIAGAGLTGGGDLSEDRTFNIGAGDGITVNSNDVALAPSVAGAGLTYNSGVLDVVSANTGIVVGANNLALTLATDPGLQIASGLKLGSPSSLTVSTTNDVSGTGHTHAVTASSDVYNAGSGVAALLKSTSAGGLTLRSANIRGTLDVTDGGDLTVAGSGSYAGSPVLFADSNGGNVGILTIPDPQFALDVNGPARAQYFIGPHAIQLKNVLLLSHFDGRQPFETNFYGEPNGHMGQVAAVSGGVTFREGMFGSKAIQVAAAATNLVVNPSFEVNVTDGWTYAQSGSGGAVSRTSFQSRVGTYSALITPSSTGNSGIFTGNISLANGATIHMQCRVYRNSSGAAALEVYDATNTTVRATATSTLDNQWEHLLASWTNSTGGAVNVRLRVWNTAGGTAQNLLVDACQAEISTDATPYLDGTMGSGHTWSGTAHNSTSARTAANVQYPTSGNINTLRGTIMGWVYRAGDTANDALLHIAGTTAGTILLRANATTLQGQWGTSTIVGGGTVPARTWTHIAMSLNGSTLSLYVNGQSVASGSMSGFDGVPATMGVGRSVSGGSLLNGLIDDLVITSVPMSANEILAVYESDAPVFAESSRFSFRATPRSLVWADDDGLWVKDTDGQAVAGFYAGEAAGYSWGGATMNPGDILFGRYGASDGGWMLFDRDGVSSKPYLSLGYADKTVFALDSGGATLDGVLDISSTGGIYQGSSGSFASPGTGLKVWNDSGAGRLAGYLSGTLQAGFDTSGRITAGGGNVLIDANGIALKGTVTSFDQSASLTFTSIASPTVLAHLTRYSAGGTAHLLLRDDGADVEIEMLGSGAGRFMNFDAGQVRVLSGGIFSVPYGSASAPTYTFNADENTGIYNVTDNTIGITTSGTKVAQFSTTSLALNSASDNIARIKPGGSHTIANDANLSLGAGTGFLFVTNSTDGHGALYYTRGTAAIELLDSNGTFSNASGTATSNNIYWDAGSSVWRLENKRGGSRSYHIIWFGLSSDF